MADTPLSTGIGQGSAQVWQSNLTNQAFNDVVRQQRLDNAAEAEAARRQAAIDAKNASDKRKFIKNELDGIVPDLGKIWEARDGDYIRNESNRKFKELFSQPGFAESLFNNDPDAISKKELFKSEIASLINKSIQDKEKVKRLKLDQVIDPYLAAREEGIFYEDQRYYPEDIERISTGYMSPLGDIDAIIERTDSDAGWKQFAKAGVDSYANRNKKERTYQNPVTGIETRTSGTQRPYEDREGDFEEYFKNPSARRDAFYKLGIPWTSTGDVPEEYNSVWNDFKSKKLEDTFYDDRERSTTGVIDDEGISEDDRAFLMDKLSILDGFTKDDLKEGDRASSAAGIDLQESTPGTYLGDPAKYKHGEFRNYKLKSSKNPGFRELESALSSHPDHELVVLAESPQGTLGFLFTDKSGNASKFIDVNDSDALASVLVGGDEFKTRKDWGLVGGRSAEQVQSSGVGSKWNKQ